MRPLCQYEDICDDHSRGRNGETTPHSWSNLVVDLCIAVDPCFAIENDLVEVVVGPHRVCPAQFRRCRPMTFVGENEGGASLRLFIFSLVGTIIFGVIVWRLLVIGRESGMAR